MSSAGTQNFWWWHLILLLVCWQIIDEKTQYSLFGLTLKLCVVCIGLTLLKAILITLLRPIYYYLLRIILGAEKHNPVECLHLVMDMDYFGHKKTWPSMLTVYIYLCVYDLDSSHKFDCVHRIWSVTDSLIIPKM